MGFKSLLKMCASFTLVGSLVCGCSSAQKTMPHIGFGNLSVEADLQRSDIVVLDRVEGQSTTTGVLFGIVQIIDGDKLKLFGISFFKDKYTIMGGFNDDFWLTFNRAYYKALEAQPEADAVFVKSMDHEDGGVPLLWWTKSITLKGKAVKIKADK